MLAVTADLGPAWVYVGVVVVAVIALVVADREEIIPVGVHAGVVFGLEDDGTGREAGEERVAGRFDH